MYEVPNSTTANLPIRLSLSTADKCNLTCVMCPHALLGNEHFINYNGATDSFHETILNCSLVALHGAGEPFCHPNFWDFIPENSQYSNNIGWNTNGLILNDTHLKNIISRNIAWLNFSIDAGTPDTYAAVRGGSWDKLWQNIRKISGAKTGKYPLLRANMTLMDRNFREIPQLTEKMASLGFEYLHVFNMNPVSSLKNPEWEVDFNDGSGKFKYRDQVCYSEQRSQELESVLVDSGKLADSLNLSVIYTGSFRGESGNFDVSAKLGYSKR